MEKQHNEMKGRTGLRRLRNAVIYSLDGYRAAWRDEEAFRQIVILLAAGLPLVLCVIVELFNTAVENVVDRISLDMHPLSKKAKDMGSAAQFTAQLFLAFVWGGYLLVRFFSWLGAERRGAGFDQSFRRIDDNGCPQ